MTLYLVALRSNKLEWMKLIGDCINYIEDNIKEDINASVIAKELNISTFYLQKGFTMICGITIGEYIRNRRLTLAAHDLMISDETVLDIALKYRYESPDSFSKAFYRLHNVHPSEVRRDKKHIKGYAPLQLTISLQGGFLMDYRIERKEEFKVIANLREFVYEGCQEAIPQFWQEHYSKGLGKYICGELGINVDLSMSNVKFEYLIADFYNQDKEIPENLFIKTIPAFDWAIFKCIGSLPETMQKLNEKIYTQWLCNQKDYEFAAGYCIEWYDDPRKYSLGTKDPKYYSEIWIPVKKRK